MHELLFLKFAHIIAFVYWLGGDLGTFLASKQVINANNSPESRHVALKIMLACDQGPKLAMPLILPLGIQLAEMMSLMNVPSWGLVAMWVFALYWFTVVIVLYANEGKPFTAVLSKIDLYFRVVLVIALVAFAIQGLLSDEFILADWLSYKILIFALMVTCGIFVRINLKPFIPAFSTMMQSGATLELNQTMALSISKCRPFVWVIWAGLFLSAALGVHLI